MTAISTGGGSERAAPLAFLTSRRGLVQLSGLAILVAVVAGAYALSDAPGQGARASLSLLLGAMLGIAFQRGRFCFFCILRDFIEFRNSAGLYAILAALAAGSIGYAIVFGAFLPNPFSGRLPPDAHIGPVSWVVVMAGIVFGLGMTLSGACISGHLYRLGEGYLRAPIALFGALVGFGLAFFTWQAIYLTTLSQAESAWLPAALGYGGALAVHLAVLLAVGLLLLRWLPPLASREGGRLTLGRIREIVLIQRWNPLVTGSLIGVIGAFFYFRVEPLGVTSQLGSIARTTLENAGLIGDRLNGLDTFAGCAALVVQTITENGWLVIGMVVGSLAVVQLANRFQFSRLTVKNSGTALLGGVLMGWSSMLALGCTVGTLLSGISAFAVAGWLFGGAVVFGVWLGIRLRLHRWG